MDLAHCVECKSGSSTIELMVGAELRDDANDRWYIQPCTKKSLFGPKKVPSSDCRSLLLAVDEVLQASERVSDIRWYPSFDTPEYLALMPHSGGPVRDADFDDRLHPLIRFYWKLDRITSAIAHPLGVASFFVLACILIVVAPRSGPVIMAVLFLTVLALCTIVPMILSVVVSREAKRISEQGG
jgi:hypothetical protein